MLEGGRPWNTSSPTKAGTASLHEIVCGAAPVELGAFVTPLDKR